MALTFSLGFNGWEGNLLLICTCKLCISLANCPTWFSKFCILDLFSFWKYKELKARDLPYLLRSYLEIDFVEIIVDYKFDQKLEGCFD